MLTFISVPLKAYGNVAQMKTRIYYYGSIFRKEQIAQALRNLIEIKLPNS